jgi:hypothetical protein
MNCPKCHINGDRWDEHERHIHEKDFDVEMEDKGVITEVVEADWINGKEKLTPIYKHLYQCPVCKEVIIQ